MPVIMEARRNELRVDRNYERNIEGERHFISSGKFVQSSDCTYIIAVWQFRESVLSPRGRHADNAGSQWGRSGSTGRSS